MVRLTKKASEAMKRGPGVFKRAGSSVWHWGIKVPADLREQYASQWAHRCSLETADLREANERASAKQAQWLQQFADKRREMNPQRLDKVTPELAQSLAQRVATQVLATDEALRSDPGAARLLLGTLRAAVPSRLTIGPPPLPDWVTAPDDPLEGLGEELATELADLNGAMDGLAAREFAMQRVAAILPLAQAEGRKLGVEFDATTPGALAALRECLRAYRKARHEIRLRDLGEVVETPSLPLQKQPSGPQKLRDVFGLWKGVKRRSDDAIRACERALALFEQRTGNPSVQNITRAQGDDFRAWLQTLGTSSKTAHDRITWVKSLLVYAYRDLELIPRQPWEGLDIEYRTTNKRGPWSPSDLKAFFGLPLFTRYELPSESKAGGAAAYWVPLLGLYTGARVGELCQLRVVDVESGEHGAFIRITEEAEGATVKSAAGHRRVPVHSELVRLGFLAYVQAMKEAGAAQLWPDMKFRKGKPGGYFSDWVNSFHKAATDNPAAPVFHELRHTVRTALHSARVDRETIGRLIGHETGLSEAEKAYTHVSDADLRRALETLAFPAIQLKANYAAPRTIRRAERHGPSDRISLG